MQYCRFFVTNGECTIGLKAPQEIEAYLNRHFPPFAQVQKSGIPNWEIDCCFKNKEVNLDPVNHFIAIPFESMTWTSLFIFRLIRNLFRLEHAKTGRSFFLHGGLVNMDGKGILYLGSKGAGKTSSLLGMLSLGDGVSYVCNDDALLKSHESIMGIGSARSISIRRSTLEALKGIFSLEFVQEEHPSNQLFSQKEYLTLYPRQISETFGNPLCPMTPIHAIVFPSITKEQGFQIQNLPYPKNIEHIIQCIEPPIDSRHSFLQPLTSDLKMDMPLEKLITIPTFTISHSLSSVKASSHAFREILHG